MKWVEIRSFLVFREELGGCSVEKAPEPRDNLMLLWVGEDRLDEILALPDRKFSRASLQARFARGNVCLGILKEGQLVAFSWAAFGQFYFGNYRFPLAAHEAYLFDAYTAPACRGEGVAGLLRYHLYQALAARGRTCLYSISMRKNQPAIRFKEKLGGRVVDAGYSVRLFGRWAFGTRARPARLRKNS